MARGHYGKLPPTAQTTPGRDTGPAAPDGTTTSGYSRSDVRIAARGVQRIDDHDLPHLLADDLDEPNETDQSWSASASSGVQPQSPTPSLTIGRPGNHRPQRVTPTSISEGAAATEATVTATLSAARAADTVVNITLGGTATDPADYTATSPIRPSPSPRVIPAPDGTLTITPVR